MALNKPNFEAAKLLAARPNYPYTAKRKLPSSNMSDINLGKLLDHITIAVANDSSAITQPISRPFPHRRFCPR